MFGLLHIKRKEGILPVLPPPSVLRKLTLTSRLSGKTLESSKKEEDHGISIFNNSTFISINIILFYTVVMTSLVRLFEVDVADCQYLTSEVTEAEVAEFAEAAMITLLGNSRPSPVMSSNLSEGSNVIEVGVGVSGIVERLGFLAFKGGVVSTVSVIVVPGIKMDLMNESKIEKKAIKNSTAMSWLL